MVVLAESNAVGEFIPQKGSINPPLDVVGLYLLSLAIGHLAFKPVPLKYLFTPLYIFGVIEVPHRRYQSD